MNTKLNDIEQAFISSIQDYEDEQGWEIDDDGVVGEGDNGSC